MDSSTVNLTPAPDTTNQPPRKHHSNKPYASSQTMLLSALPEGLRSLVESKENPPHLRFTVDELDKIVEGKQGEEMESSFADGFYLSYVLPALNWWIDVSESIALGRSMGGITCEPEFEGQRAKLIVLLNDALSNYAAALAEGPYFTDSISALAPAGMEFLKRYRLYTRAVCDFGQEVWPEVDLGWLSKQA
jgi:hypothetical protein